MLNILRWLQLPFAGLCLWAATLQLNDQDPALWIGVYVGAAILSILAFCRVGGSWPATVFGFAAAVGATYLSFRVLGQQSLVSSEEGREMLGLAILSVWMCGVVWTHSQNQSANSPSAE